MSFFGELRRRNVVKVAVAYAIVGWLLVEVSSVLAPALRLPEWVPSLVALLLILGFPVAMLLTWAYELTPDGMKKTKSVPLSASITKVTGRKLDFAIIGALVLALGFVVYNDGSDDAPSPGPEIMVDTFVDTLPLVVTAEQRDVLPNSVAVLPFENLSPDPNNAFFAAGIHDTILNELAKLRNMNVIARTSVLPYADGQTPIPEIAEELNVETVMEGSVQYADDRILVTAQLIDPETNAHLWSDSYNREFSDIFAIQADIAMNIANALEAEFSLEEQQSIEKIPTDSPEAYRFYLAALDVFDDLRIDLLTQAILADPDFAAAYALRAQAYVGTLATLPVGESGVAEREALALRELDRALDLDPNLSLAHVIRAQIHAWNWRGREAREAYERAYQLSPKDPFVLTNYGNFLAFAGPQEEAIELHKSALQLDPREGPHFLAHAYELMGDLDAAAAGYRAHIERFPIDPRSRAHLVQVELLSGNIAEAEGLLPLAERIAMSAPSAVMLPQIAYAYVQIGQHEDASRVLSEYERRAANGRQAGVTWVIFHLARGEDEEAFDWLERAAEREPYEGYNLVYRVKNNVFGSSILNQPEFVALRDQLGFTDL